MEAFEYKGRWWLPERPNQQVAGTLKFDPIEGGTLETLGDDFTHQISDLYGIPFGDATIVPDKVIGAICGFTNQGDPVTLYKCMGSGTNLAVGYLGSTYHIQVIFIGHHFEKEEDIVFESMAINYSNLDEWVGKKSLVLSQQQEPLKINVSYVRQVHIDFPTTKAVISFHQDFRWKIPTISEISLKYITFVNMTPSQPMHYNKFQGDIIYHIRNFLSLGIGTAVLPHKVKAKVHIDKSQSSEEIDDSKHNIWIFYVPKGINVRKAEKLQGNMLFRFRDVAEKFEEYLETWFSKADDLREVFDLYFGIFYIPSIYIHLEFLTLAQALETYHRRMYGGTYMSEEEYKTFGQEIEKAIPNELSKDHQESLKSRIKYGYEYSLRKRLSLILSEVLAPYEITVNKLISNQKEFINKLVDTRNYLTHYSKELEETAIISPYSQRELVEKMKLLMQLCFMKEMDFPADTVDIVIAS